MKTECPQFVKQLVTFFQEKTAVKPCNLQFFDHAVSQFKSLSTYRPDLEDSVRCLIGTINGLIPEIHDQQTFDQIGRALLLTGRYVESKIKTKEDLQSRLQLECGIVLQKHQKHTIEGYTLSAAIFLASLALGGSLPYVALALAVAGAIAALTHQHTHSPQRIIGDKLFHSGFEPPALKSKYEPEIITYMYGF